MADGRLGDIDHFIQVLQPFDFIVGTGIQLGSMQLGSQFRIQNIIDQRTLTGA